MVKVTNLRKKKYEPSSEYQAMKENIKTNGTQYDIDDSFIQAFYDDSSSFMSDSRTSLEGNGYSNAKSNYNSFIERYRDLNDRKGYITAYMNSIKDSMDEDEYKNAMSYMDSFDSDSDRYYNAFRGQSSFYSRFKTEDDYNRYKIGWLSDNSDDNYTSDKINARRDYLTKQESRIAELDDLIKSASGEEKKNLKAEKEALVADVNQYKRSSQGVRDEYYGYTFKDDFEADSKKRNYNNPTKEAIDEQDSYASGFYDTLGGRGIVEEDEKTGEYILDDGTRVKSPDALDIPDKLGAFLSASEEDIKEAYTRMNSSNGNVTSTWDNLMQEGETHRWDLLDDNEIAIYYYLYDNQGQDAAYKFLDDMAVDLGRRENEETSKEYDSSNVLKKIAYNVASIPASVFGGVAGFIDDAVNTVQGEEINPYSAAHRLQNFSGIVRSNTAEDINNATNNVSIPGLGFTAGDAYQALMSGADSLFGGKTFGRGFTALMGAGAASQTAQDLYEKGATNTQIAFGSVSAGVAETLFEYVSLDKLLSTTSTKSFGGMVKQVLAQAGVEASEEMATEIANTISDALVMRSQSEWMKLYQEGGFQNAFNETLKNVLSAGLGGAISGGVMAGLSSGANLAMYNNSMKRYGADLYNSGAVDTYKDYANNNDVSADAQKAMQKMEEAVGDSVENDSDGNKLRGKAYRSIGKFADSIDSAMYEDATKAEIRSRLESKEIDVTDKLVNDVYKYITNDADIKFASKETRSIAKEIINDSKSFNGNVSSRMAASRIGMVVDHTTRKSITASSKKASEAVAERVSDTESTVISETGEEVKINKVSSIENGEMILELSDGRKVNSKEVKYASESEALAYESALDLGCSTESANAIVRSLSSVSDESVSRYILGVGEAYRYGLIGQSIDTISKDGFASDLTDKQLKFAYDLGRSDAGTKASQEQEALNAKKGESKRKGRILLSTSVSSLTDRQRTSVAAVGRVVSDITHNDVVFYESVVKDGNRVFSKDIAGHKAGESAPNGFYNSGNGAIYIDINAGNMGEGTILFTAAHEMTHFIKEWSPEKFKVLSDFLMEEYGKKGVDVNQLVQNQIEKAKKNGRSLSFDDAYEEVIADSMETMFTDTNLSEKLSKLKVKDKTLWEKFKSFFADLFKKIKDAYKELDPQTQEGMYVKQMMDSIEKISDLFADALVDAGDTFMKVGADVGGVSMEYTINDAIDGTDVSDITRKPVQKLQERTEYEKYPKEMIKITSSGAERSAMNITINGKKFSGDASVRELRNARFAENGFKANDVLRVNKFLDKMRDYMKKARLEYKYIGLQDIYDAKIIISPTTGNIVLSGLVNNGEYEINFDFTKTCKKRLALQDVIEQLAREKGRSNADGTQTEVNLSEENIRHINEVLAANGIETACLCCFVESKRYAMQAHFQEKVCDVWNRLVDEVNAEEGITEEASYFNFADQEIETSKIPDSEFDNLYAEMERWRNTKYVDNEGGEGSIERKMKAFLKNSPSSRKKLRLSDFVTERGRTNLHKLYPEIESLAKSKIGTALPKAVESFAPYNGEIELMSVSGKEDLATYAKKIAGARSRSFSDFIMSHIYDVLQKTASFTARKMPAHTYTKEISRARLFGMTGEKTNLSVIHDIDPNVDSWNAGLKSDGSYYVSDYDAFRKGLCNQIQAIPDSESIALQNDPRYSRDCGRIGVGFSYSHMMKMHNDPDIRQVIGYHLSSLPAAVKPLTNLDKSTDYTGVQNTLKFKGFKKPNYVIPEGIPSYATAPQDIEAYNEKGKKISKFSKVTGASFDIKGTYEELCKNMDSTKAAKETLRQLLQYADDNGLAIETSKAQAGHGDFDLYGDTEATQNPYQTADNYIEYCISRGMIPMFYEFALNDNYYKDIYDFNVFDRLSYNPETGLHEDSADRKAYAPQTPVHMVNDDGSMAFPDDFWELVDKYMKDFNYQREDFAKKFPKVMEEVRAVKDIKGNPMVFSVQKNSVMSEFADTTTGENVKYSIREEDPPKNTIKGYKVFFVKDGKLYPPMVANPNGADTPVGVWLNADIGTQAPDSKTGRKQVKAGGKGTQGGSGSLAFRPGWHLGETPLATQFDRLNLETGVKELFPENFVWAECDIAADVDYQEEAMSYGYNKNGKFQHSLAGLPKLPENGYYRYRTNPNPDTVPWLITGAMKVNRLLSDDEVNEILAEKGIAPKQRQGGNKTLADLGLSQYEGVKYSERESGLIEYNEAELLDPYSIETVNAVTDTEKFKYLTEEFEKNGYSGRPIVTVVDVDRVIALTGSHRIYAAKEAGIEIPSIVIQYDSDNSGMLDELIEARTDEDRLYVARELYEDGIISKTAYDLIKREDELNSKNYGVPIDKQLKYSDRDSDGNKLTKDQQEFFKDSKVRDEDGNLRVVYHGTTEEFTVFDRTKSRTNMDIQGSFFSPWDIDAGGYGGKVGAYYLNIKNPAPEGIGYKALKRFKGQNGAGIKAREYLESLGYDGVNNGDEEYIAFYPEQIKKIDNTKPTSDPDIRYSARKEFSSEIDQWDKDGRPDNEKFILGSTGDVLQGLGAIESDIYMLGDKIKKIMQDHTEMTLDEIKKIPQILDNPVLILESRNIERGNKNNTRLVMFGSVKAKDGMPVLVALDLRPVEKHLVIDGMQKVVSAYTKDNNPVDFFRNSNVLFLNNKKTTSLLRTIGFQMPIELNESGYIGSISYKGQNVNFDGKQFSMVVTEKSSRNSDRNPDSIDNRTLLANALESTAQNDIEKKYISDYQANIEKINAEQEKLSKLRAEIKDMSFSKGARDDSWKQKMNKLRDEATKTANRINTYDKKLFKLESAKPLKDVLDREKALAVKKAEVAGRDALNAYREKAAQNQRELMNRYKERTDRRKATEVRNKIKKVSEDLTKRLLNPTERKYIPKALVDGVIRVCNEIDPTGVNQDTKYAQKYRSGLEALRDLKAQYDSITDMDYDFSSEFSREFSDSIEQLAKSVGDTPLRDMSKAQLEDVYAIVSDISAMVKNATKQIGTSEAITNYDAGQELISLMESIKGLGLTTNKVSSMFRNWTVNPMRAVKEMSAFDPNSRLIKLFDSLNEGRRKADMFMMENSKKFEALRADKEGEKAYNDAVEKPFDFGLGFKISKMQAMQAILTYEREQANKNRNHLEAPVMFTDVTLDVKGKYSDAFDNGTEITVDDQFVKAVTDKLSDWDKKYLDAARTFFEVDSKNAVNEVSLLTKHRIVATEKSYIPYKVNSDYIQNDSENVKYDSSIEGSGVLKSVKNNAKQQLVMRGLNSVIDEHMNTVAKIYGLSIPVRNWNKVFNMMQTKDDGGISVKRAIRDAWGTKGLNLLDQAVADLQSKRRGDTVPLVNAIKSAFVSSTLASNISVWMKQAASYPTAGAILSTKSLNKGLAYLPVIRKMSGIKLQELYDEIDSHTSQHWIRRKGLSTQELGEMNQSNGWQNKLNKKLGKASPMNWIQAMDVWTTASLWVACKAEVDGMGIKSGSERYWNEVTKLYDRVIEETQPMYDPLHRAEITKNERLSNVIMFQTQPLQNSGILREGAMQYKMAKKQYGNKSIQAKKAGKKFGKAVASQIASHFVFTSMTLLAASILHKMNPWRDDDQELTLESVSTEFLIQFGENLFGAVVPVIGNHATQILEKFIGGNKYDVLSDSIIDKVNRTIDAFTKSKENPSFDSLTNMACEVASYFGIPAKNMYNIVNGARLHVEDAINGELLSFEAGVERSPSQDYGRLYNAIVNGDTKEVGKLKEKYGDDYTKELRKALRENDPRIQSAAEERYNGDLEEYKRIALEIKGEGNFSQDDIVSAINSAYNKLDTDDGDSETGDKHKGLFDTSDLEAAIEDNDGGMVGDIKEDFIDTKMSNGKSQEDAEKATETAIRKVIKSSFDDGDISSSDAISALTSYGGMESEDARSRVKYWEFSNDNPSIDISEEAVSKYYEAVEPYGISVNVYVDYYERQKEAKGVDANGDGKIDSGSRKAKVLLIIDSLPISSDQKDVLYDLNGWSRKTIYEAPWH